MRSNLELWLIVEENFDELFEDGCLCDILVDLECDSIISNDEFKHLISIIQEYGFKRKFIRYYGQKGIYYWKVGHKKPRKMFIQKQILKAIRNEN